MNIQDIINRLKSMENPYGLDPHIGEDYAPEMSMALYITTLRGDIEEAIKDGTLHI